MQTIKEIVECLDELKKAICYIPYLKKYQKRLDEITALLKGDNIPQRCWESNVVEGYTQFADGFVRIYSRTDDYNYFKEFIVDGESDLPVSLTDCLKILMKDTGKPLAEVGVVYVEFADALQGKMYQYGNYSDKKWYRYGETVGYC